METLLARSIVEVTPLQVESLEVEKAIFKESFNMD